MEERPADDVSEDVLAPAVVAILVTRDPGPWFEETLAALAAQDYAALSVLVMVLGGDEDPTPRVAGVLPGAFVRRLDDDRGYGAAVDEALQLVEGASFYLLCHDDCAPEPDAVHLLVEEAYRSNAGVVTPKMLRWDDPSVLLHVGMNVDKTGAVVERVHPGEIDHGQHDAVRDVFSVAGGFTLVRADLLAELGGFDTAMVAMGEYLDLCWRVQVAGARVLVVPDARVRHLETVAGGIRPVAAAAGERVPPTLQALQRRHELRALLKCYGPLHRIRVLPQALLLALGEVLVSLAVRDRARARAVAGAWWWNLRRHGELRKLRAAVTAHRVLPDKEVRQLQLRGSARLSTYVSRVVHQDFDVAHGRTPSAGDATAPGVSPAAGVSSAAGVSPAADEPVLTGGVGLAFSEDADFDTLDDLGRRSGRDRFGRRRRQPVLGLGRSRLAVWLVVAVVWVVGTRDLFSGGLPLIGQFVPLPSWTGAWHIFTTGWQPAGVGTTAPATPAFGLLGLLGTGTVGGMGLLEKVLMLGCMPLGAWGVARLLRPLASPRARLVAAVCYLGLPLSYDALATGRLDGLVAFAAAPWVLSRLARSSGLPPFAEPAPASIGWRARFLGQMVKLGVIEAVAVSFAPAVAVVVLVCGVGIVVGSLAVGEWRGSLRVLAVASGATAVAAVLCLPWVVGVLAAGRGAVSVFGLPGSAATAPSWSDLLRFAVGPTGESALSWLLVAAALLPLLIGRQARLAWAGRLWAVACCSWVLALVAARGWAAPFSPSVDVLLAPAAVAVAAGIGLGVSAFEHDLAGYHFGWRQCVTALVVAVAVVGLLPVLGAAGGGRWDLVSTGYDQTLSFMASGAGTSGAAAGAGASGAGTSGAAAGAGASGAGGPAASGGFRVLWLGDPRVLPLGGWEVSPGLAYATSEGGLPGAADLWAPASPGPAATLAAAVDLARQGRTDRLGQLLAPAGVRYVVVVGALAPEVVGVQQPPAFPPPAGLVGSLLDQTDLAQVGSGAGGYDVFENTAAMPERAARTAGPLPETGAPGWPTAAAVAGWQPVLPGSPGSQSYSGQVAVGALFASYAPAGRWHLVVAGHAVPGSPAFGWAAQFRPVPAGAATLSFGGSPLDLLGALFELLLWAAVAVVLVGRRRWLARWRRRRDGAGAGSDPAGDGAS